MDHNDFNFLLSAIYQKIQTVTIIFGSVGELWFFYLLYQILRRTKKKVSEIDQFLFLPSTSRW
jgi:hypothetical protein